jgi:hypothetical protein
MLAPQLRQALLRLSRNEQAKDLAQYAPRGPAGFTKAGTPASALVPLSAA